MHWPSVLQLGFSLVGALTLWGIAGVLVMTVVGTVLDDPGLAATNERVYLLLQAAGIGFGGVLLLPSAGYAFLRLIQKPSPIRFKLGHPGWLILLVPPLVGLGYLVAQIPGVAWLALPLIHVITIGISMLWLVTLSIRGLPVGSKQRVWGVFGTGLIVAPFLSLVMEGVVIIGVAFLGISYLSRDPVFAQDLTQLTERFLAHPDQPPDAILALFEPYLLNPITLYIVLVVAAVLVPLIEEFFKPVGVWLLAGRQPTPAEGF
ncbi:MAG: hypothetical protein MUO62_01635, partial [Anaerolineales bacterium]|nr:hypothetical protein [Anaerolineales bacterium]